MGKMYRFRLRVTICYPKQLCQLSGTCPETNLLPRSIYVQRKAAAAGKMRLAICCSLTIMAHTRLNDLALTSLRMQKALWIMSLAGLSQGSAMGLICLSVYETDSCIRGLMLLSASHIIQFCVFVTSLSLWFLTPSVSSINEIDLSDEIYNGSYPVQKLIQ